MYKESLKEKTAVVAPVPVADDTDRFKHLEKSIERTLSFAESAAAETKAAAQAEADAILSAAKTQAAEIISAARARSYELEQDIADLESRYELMKTRVKLLLYAEIELLDKNESLAEKEAQAEETK